MSLPVPPASPRPPQPPHQTVAKASLTAFRSCPDALNALRSAAEKSVTADGLPGAAASSRHSVDFAAKGAAPAPAAAPAAAGGAAGAADGSTSAANGSAASGIQGTPAYSGTNDYQADVDEPDLVKTDGYRIVTVSGGVLEVIDAASHRVTGRLHLASAGIQGAYQANLLLSGNHALLFAPYASVNNDIASTGPQYGSRFVLIDLTGTPRVIASYSINGALIDARLVGSVVRIVTASQPVIDYPAMPDSTSSAERVATYQAVTGRAGLGSWLPEYNSSSGGVTISGRVPCTAVSRPAVYSGTNMLTVLTFDLSQDSFGSGDPVSVVADGDTVYGTTTSLYVANGEMTRPFSSAGSSLPQGTRQQTQIYRFDITAPGAPRFAASGTVPGYLVDQYAMSEWNGYLRVATTTGTSWSIADGRPEGARTSSSAVYEMTTSGPVMRIVGAVAGLGSSERIYAVRFMGPVGYVVTFRQTDPLYTVDLSDPSHPRVVGALGLTGYSAYLHPVSLTELIGVGQEADSLGHVLGAQVSLFDVSDLAAPARLATYALAHSKSAVQFDPHAFLYWPADQLVVIPMQTTGVTAAGSLQPVQLWQSGALVLRINGMSIAKAGFIRQPRSGAYLSSIERSLVIGQTLWTISSGGVLASDLTTLRQQAWLPFPGAPRSYPAPEGALP